MMELHLFSFYYEPWCWWVDLLNIATNTYNGSLFVLEHNNGVWRWDVLWLRELVLKLRKTD